MLQPDTKAEATKHAKALKAKMNDKGWKIRVWNNIFWCYGIQKPYVHIGEETYGGRKPTYTVYFSTDIDGPGGDAIWFNKKNYHDPNKAMEAQRRSAKRYIKKCQDALDAIS